MLFVKPVVLSYRGSKAAELQAPRNNKIQAEDGYIPVSGDSEHEGTDLKADMVALTLALPRECLSQDHDHNFGELFIH